MPQEKNNLEIERALTGTLKSSAFCSMCGRTEFEAEICLLEGPGLFHGVCNSIRSDPEHNGYSNEQDKAIKKAGLTWGGQQFKIWACKNGERRAP